MNRTRHNLPRIAGWQALFLAISISLTLAATVAYVTLGNRERIRKQILSRDAELLEAVTWQAATSRVYGDVWEAVYQASELRGVIAVRVRAANGRTLEVVPETLREQAPSGEVPATGRATRLYESLPLASLFRESPELALEEGPVLWVGLRLPDTAATGGLTFEYWLDGSSARAEWTALDQTLLRQALVIVAAGTAAIALLVGLSSRRLRRFATALEERSRELESANAELMLAAKASAVGAISAHLVHGQKNLLAALRSELKRLPGAEAALVATQRMQEALLEATRVLGAKASLDETRLTAAEVAEVVANRFQAVAQNAGKGWRVDVHSGAAGWTLGGNEAHLVLLILANLVENALEVTRAGDTVTLVVAAAGADLVYEVGDTGRGIAAEVAAAVFEPGTTTKPGGSGLGLSISRHLARHLGGTSTSWRRGPARRAFG